MVLSMYHEYRNVYRGMAVFFFLIMSMFFKIKNRIKVINIRFEENVTTFLRFVTILGNFLMMR